MGATVTALVARVRAHLLPSITLDNEDDIQPELTAALDELNTRVRATAEADLTITDAVGRPESLTGWASDSVIREVEYPVDEVPRVLLSPSSWRQGTDGTGAYLRLASSVGADEVRVTYSVPYVMDLVADTSTFTGTATESLALLAAANILDGMARRFAQKASMMVVGQVYEGPSPGTLARLAKEARDRAWDVYRRPAVAFGDEPVMSALEIVP